MDTALQERIRVAKEVFNLVVDRWLSREHVKETLDRYVETARIDVVDDRRLQQLIQRVSQLPPAQIAWDEVERIMNPIAAEEDEQARQQRVAYQLEQVLGAYDNQDPEVIRMYGMMLQNPPRSNDDLRRFCDYFVTTLPPESPNRARIQSYLRATAPQPNHAPQQGANPQSVSRSAQQPTSRPVAQPSPHSYSNPAPARSSAVERAPIPQNRVLPNEVTDNSGNIFGNFRGTFFGGCIWLIIYIVGLGIAGALALIFFGAFLAENSGFYSTDAGQGLGAATGYISTGMGVFLWLRQQTSSKLLMARFVMMLLASSGAMYFVVSSGLIDLNALANTSGSDREQLLGLGTMAVSGATTVYLWAKNLLRQMYWLALLALVGGGGLALIFYVGAIDVNAMVNSIRDLFSNAQ